jgi:hypothetical protein
VYHVRWSKAALDQLAASWAAADSALRQQITQASHEVDSQLRKKPAEKGESRPKRGRIFFVQPLAVTFRVNEQRNQVSVLFVRVYQRRKPRS